MSGYFGIGILHGKTKANLGTLWRSAGLFGASFIFTIGERYKFQSSDTEKTYRRIPLYNYKDFSEFYKMMPYDCQLVGVELLENSIEIKKFEHPKRCIYLLGAEDHGLTNEAIKQCHKTIILPGDRSMNVAVAGSIVMYDRLVK